MVGLHLGRWIKGILFNLISSIVIFVFLLPFGVLGNIFTNNLGVTVALVAAIIIGVPYLTGWMAEWIGDWWT